MLVKEDLGTAVKGIEGTKQGACASGSHDSGWRRLESGHAFRSKTNMVVKYMKDTSRMNVYEWKSSHLLACFANKSANVGYLGKMLYRNPGVIMEYW